MKQLMCEMCCSTDLLKQDGVFVCQACGCKYSVEEAKRMMIEGTVDVQGTVKVDNSAFVQKYLANARRAYEKEDWEEVEKYYNMVEQNDPQNIEAVFYSAYAKARTSLLQNDYNKRKAAFNVFGKSISVIDDYFDMTQEDAQIALVKRMSIDLMKMYGCEKVRADLSGSKLYGASGANYESGSYPWTNRLLKESCQKFIESLEHIMSSSEKAKKELASHLEAHKNKLPGFKEFGCYVATAVYGSYDCPQVWTLRRYRDDRLASTWHGRAFIRTYYAISPTLVKWFGHTQWFRKMWKGKLDRMVANLNAEGVENTPYQDKAW